MGLQRCRKRKCILTNKESEHEKVEEQNSATKRRQTGGAFEILALPIFLIYEILSRLPIDTILNTLTPPPNLYTYTVFSLKQKVINLVDKGSGSNRLWSLTTNLVGIFNEQKLTIWDLLDKQEGSDATTWEQFEKYLYHCDYQRLTWQLFRDITLNFLQGSYNYLSTLESWPDLEIKPITCFIHYLRNTPRQPRWINNVIKSHSKKIKVTLPGIPKSREERHIIYWMLQFRIPNHYLLHKYKEANSKYSLKLLTAHRKVLWSVKELSVPIQVFIHVFKGYEQLKFITPGIRLVNSFRTTILGMLLNSRQHLQITLEVISKAEKTVPRKKKTVRRGRTLAEAILQVEIQCMHSRNMLSKYYLHLEDRVGFQMRKSCNEPPAPTP